MAKIEFRPDGLMGKQALEALIDSNEQSDILWSGQKLETIAKNGSRMNSSDRSKLHSELSYQASLGLGNGYWDELRRKILIEN